MMINGTALKTARVNGGMGQAQLAQGICSTSMICQIEKGKANPSEALVGKLAEKLGIPVEELLYSDDHK
jgi:transcriptional regulator with XRE-family HTH domain